MTDAELLQAVKESLGITGEAQDQTLKRYIQEVEEYLTDGGVSKGFFETEACVGILARGVSDLWSYSGGDVKFSPYFYERAVQLTYRRDEDV